MLDLGKVNDIEVCLFVGPRAEWDLGAQATSPSGSALAPSLHGTRQLTQAIRELVHACDLGLRCVLVADLGLMMLIKQLKERGDLPLDLKIKTSAVLPSSNPASAKVLEDYGATSLNVAADLSTRAEINTRFGWVKNSANLAALAPWVLFLILRSQENAKLAYQQSFGKALLLSGLILTLIAYLWMNQIAKLPKAKRLFTVSIADK